MYDYAKALSDWNDRVLESLEDDYLDPDDYFDDEEDEENDPGRSD